MIIRIIQINQTQIMIMIPIIIMIIMIIIIIMIMIIIIIVIMIQGAPGRPRRGLPTSQAARGAGLPVRALAEP